MFKGILKKDSSTNPVRPPYSPDNDFIFSEICPTCDGVCSTSCEENIIKIVENTPQVDFSESGCTYCNECVDICEKNVLNMENSKNIKTKIELNILSCMAWHNVICSSCRDSCLDGAIKFLGMFRPEIDYDRCTNCGFCIATCPSQAISSIQK